MIKFFERLRTEGFKAVLEQLPVGANEECYARSRLLPMGNLANLSGSQREPILRAMNAELNLYDDEFPTRYLKEFLEYMELDMDSLNTTIDKFRRAIIWKKTGGQWKLRQQVAKLK